MRILFSNPLSSSMLYGSFVLACFTVAAVHGQSLSFNSSIGNAGGGSANGTSTNAQFYLPAGVAADGSGNIYVADSANNVIRLISSGGGVSTFAGTAGVAGSSNGAVTSALFNQPQAVAVDAAGNVYVTDSGNDTIRKISAGVVSTFAGSVGIAGSNNATGTNATFNLPQGIAVDSATNLYVADYGNNVVRKITAAGVVTTLAGNSTTNGSLNATGTNALFYQPQGIAVDPAGNVYVSDTANATIRKITSGGVVTTLAGAAGTNGSLNGTSTNAEFYQPLGIGLDSSTNLYVADFFNNTIRKITSAGVVTTLAGAVGTNGSANGVSNNARFWGPNGVVVSGGNIYVSDYYNGTIREVTTSGVATTFAGSPSAGSVDGSNSVARFNVPVSGAVDTLSNVYIADSANSTIRKITPAGVTTTFAGSPGVFGAVDNSGTNALFNAPQAVATDNANNIYVADTGNHTIRKITSGGTVSTIAGFAGFPGNADGIGTNAQFFSPQGIVVDNAGNIYVSDTGNNTIRKITSLGVVTTIGGSSIMNPGSTDGTSTNALFNTPKGLALDSSTNLYIADSLNHTIRQLTPAGISSTLVGYAGILGNTDGTNNGALFFEPSDIVVDASGNLYVTDTGNHTIRKITQSGTNWISSTVAGLAGTPGSSNGVGSAVRFNFPQGIALDSSGNFYVADTGNNTIRFDGNVFVPLAISNVTVTSRRTAAIISWATSTSSSTQVGYGLTPSYSSFTTFDPTLVTGHEALLIGLLTNSTYYYEVLSTANGITVTNTGSFSTDNQIIMTSSQANYTGVWISDSAITDNYSTPFYYSSTVPSPDTAQATFRPTIVLPANYDVYLWYSEGSDRSIEAPATVSYSGGSVSTTVNEELPGGSWHLLAGNEPFAAGTNGFLRLGNGTGETGKIVIADAARWDYSPAQDLPANGVVPAWWLQYYYGTTNVNSSSHGANGYSLLSDYILGISPFDPNTVLNFNFQKTKNGFQATFSPYLPGGRLYQLQAATNMVNPIWTNVTSLAAVPTNGNQAVFTGTNSTGVGAVFYRLCVTLTP